MPAPIALFVYRRPQHLVSVLAGLTWNAEARNTLLYVFSDAPSNASADEDVRKVREAVQKIRGFADVRIVHREHNFGLARNIVDGVSRVLSAHDEVIVLEDDLVPGPHMLRFFNDALALYRDEPRVANITAYCYPVQEPLPETFLLRGADCCWGWATWRDRWQHFSADGAQLLAKLRQANLTHAFDLDGAVQFTNMLEDQIEGRNDSWAVRWHASCFIRDVLTLYPGRSLVRNIGFDGVNSTHCSKTDRYDVDVHTEQVTVDRIPIAENAQARAIYRDFHLHMRPPFFRARKLLRGLRRSIVPTAAVAQR